MSINSFNTTETANQFKMNSQNALATATVSRTNLMKQQLLNDMDSLLSNGKL